MLPAHMERTPNYNGLLYLSRNLHKLFYASFGTQNYVGIEAASLLGQEPMPYSEIQTFFENRSRNPNPTADQSCDKSFVLKNLQKMIKI